MKLNNLFIFSLIAVLSSCGSGEDSGSNSKSFDINTIEKGEELSKYIMPHFYDIELSNYSFPKSAYNIIDELLEITLQFKNSDMNTKVSEETRAKYSMQIDVLANEIQNMDSESQSILHDYSNPLRELFNEIENSTSEDMYTTNIREAQIYLTNFRKLFPE